MSPNKTKKGTSKFLEVPEAKGEILRRCVKTTKVNVRGVLKKCEKSVKSDFILEMLWRSSNR